MTEVGELREICDEVVGHEPQARRGRGVAAGDDDGVAADVGDAALAGQRRRQQCAELRGPGFLIRSAPEKLLQWSMCMSKSPVAFTQQIIYLAAGHLNSHRPASLRDFCDGVRDGDQGWRPGRGAAPEDNNRIRTTIRV